MVYEGLLASNPFTLEDIPALAEEWRVETAGEGAAAHTVLRFRLKENLRWNDGTPLTAGDLKATIDFVHKNEIPRFFDAVKDVAKTEAPNARELTVTMKGVSYWYLDNVAGLPWMPARIVENVKDWQNWDPLDHEEKFGPCGLVGAGPFMLEEYRPGEYVMMKRNPCYLRLPEEVERR